MRKILVAVPYYHYIEPETEVSLRSLDEIEGVDVERYQCHHIPKGRNALIQKMRIGGYDYIFFLDADTAIRTIDLQLLIDVDKPVVSGLYALLLNNTVRWAVGIEKSGDGYVWLTGDPTLPMPVQTTGAGCLLIKREVFSAIEWPWFDFELAKGGNIRGEDFSFCQKCSDGGFEIWLQPKVVAAHFKKMDISRLVVRAHAIDVALDYR